MPRSLALVSSLGVCCALLAPTAATQVEVQALQGFPPETPEWFGRGVSVAGDRLAVGCYRDEGLPGGAQTGAAYVFLRDAAGTPHDPSDDAWSLEDKLIYPNSPNTGAGFGYDVALDRERLLVGAPSATLMQGGSSVGAAYVYRREGLAWVFEARLLAEGGESNAFGSHIALSGDYALIGSPGDHQAPWFYAGHAYLFRRDDGGTPLDASDDTWLQQARLQGGVQGSFFHFGWDVALDGDRALVGARGEGDVDDAGAAYVFERDDRGTADPADDLWPQVARITPDLPTIFDQFGQSVALDGDTALIGARFDVALPPSCGVAYVFEHDDAGTPNDPSDDDWPQQTQLTAESPAADELFGEFVALDGDLALVSSRRHGPADDNGMLHVFRSEGSNWVRAGEVSLPHGQIGGINVALDGGTALAGVSAEADFTPAPGAAHVIALERQPWEWIGAGLAGAGGAPSLLGAGLLMPGNPTSLSVHDSVPAGVAVLVLGVSALDLPFKGGTLVPSPDALLVLPLDGAGEFAVTAAWPGSVPSGLVLWLQAWIADAGGPAGFSATNGLSMTVP